MTTLAAPRHKHTSALTQNLRQTLTVSRRNIEKWVEEQKAAADAACTVHRDIVADRQARIDDAAAHLLSLRLEQGLTVEGSSENLEKERENVENEMVTLRERLDRQQEKLAALEKKHDETKRKALAAQRKRQDEEIVTLTTVDDLTKGIVNYKYLGLDFEKAGEDQLRFRFTQLDPNAPHRQFSFELEATENDWHVDNCQPPLDRDFIDTLVTDLEETEDMLVFVGFMREAFVEFVEREKKETGAYQSPLLGK